MQDQRRKPKGPRWFWVSDRDKCFFIHNDRRERNINTGWAVALLMKTPAVLWTVLFEAVAWGWAAFAGVGGLLLLIHLGPWPPTNGWFAMFSGIALCPLTAILVRSFAGVTPSRRARFVVALLIILAGRIAILVEHALHVHLPNA